MTPIEQPNLLQAYGQYFTQSSVNAFWAKYESMNEEFDQIFYSKTATQEQIDGFFEKKKQLFEQETQAGLLVKATEREIAIYEAIEKLRDDCVCESKAFWGTSSYIREGSIETTYGRIYCKAHVIEAGHATKCRTEVPRFFID